MSEIVSKNLNNSLFSIKFTSENTERIILYILKYCTDYLKQFDYLSDGFTNNKEEKRYDLNLRPSHGNYNITYNDMNINLIYTKSSIFVATAEELKFYEELTLSCSNKEILLIFIEDARKKNSTPNKNQKLLCRILKQGGGWSILNTIHKRDPSTLFMDIDLEEIFSNIQMFLDEEDQYLKYGVPFKMNFLLYGLPGSGKSSLITTIASKFDFDIAYLNITKDLDDNTFTRAITNLPDNSILVIEDMDALFIERDSKSCLSFSTVLNVLDGIIRKHKLITFITTNHKDKLDLALKRSGRIDYEIEFKHASKKQITNMYNHFFPDDKEGLKKFLHFSRNLKFTTSDLNTFLFKNRKSNIIDNLDHFTEIINKNLDSSPPEHLYI